MLNYSNLNDMEFEALCKDIMERKLRVSLRRFGPGKDGGIDLTDDTSTKSIIIQVKHYRNSTTEQLVRSLKNELPKVNSLAPQQYYICCSRELSAANINELYLHFQPYMESHRQIITILEIDDLLKQNAYRDILKKHFKLWLDDTGILQELGNDAIFVDCEAFLDDADNLHKLFVRTKAFDYALNALENDRILCIIGDPGVGKSITSKMLVLNYAAQGYRVRYTTNVTDLGTLKASLRSDPDTKEVILLDDCFGQAYFEMKSTQSTELIYLIKYIKRRPNKILILNSRVTIFQEAQQRQRDLMQCLENDDFKIYILDINELSVEEKAKILYNHLAFSDIPTDYFMDIRTERRYRRILNHRNYNPRIVEFVCHPSRYQTVSPTEFFHFFLKHLDNPSEMWKDEYDDRLKLEDRILLQTIYSLTTTTVDIELVQLCFDQRIARIPSIDKTVDQFSRALKRLNQGFVKILDYRGTRYLMMQNPSINDFLDGRILPNGLERTDILSSICAIDQLRLLPEEQRIPYVVDLLRTGKIDQFVFLKPEDRSAVIGHCILASSLCMDKYQSEFLDYLMHRRYSSYLFYSPLPGEVNFQKQIFETRIWDFYNLKIFFEEADHLYQFLGLLGLDDGVVFIRAMDKYFRGEDRISYARQVERYLAKAIEEYRRVDAAYYEISLDIESAVHLATYYTYDGYDVDKNKAAIILGDSIRELVFDEFEFIISKLPEQFQYLGDDIQKADFVVIGSDNIIDDYLSDLPGLYDPDDIEEYIHNDEPPYSIVDAIFER